MIQGSRSRRDRFPTARLQSGPERRVHRNRGFRAGRAGRGFLRAISPLFLTAGPAGRSLPGEMKRSFAATLVGALAFGLMPGALAAAPEKGKAGEAALSGKAVFLKKKCNICHSVSSASIVATAEKWKKMDLDLTKSARKDPGFSTKLASYLRRKAKRNGRAHLAPFKGSDEELQALVDWLVSLKARQ